MKKNTGTDTLTEQVMASLESEPMETGTNRPLEEVEKGKQAKKLFQERKAQLARIPTGALLIDLMAGGDKGVEGLNNYSIWNFWGGSSSAKSFLAVEVIANARKMFGEKLRWNYDNSESSVPFNTQRLYGFDIMPEKETTKSETVEELFCNVKTFVEKAKEDEFSIYVVDSLDGLQSKEQKKMSEERMKAFESNKEFKKDSYKMGKAKFLSTEFFPDIASMCEKKNCLVIIISQTRTNVNAGLYEPKETRAGGDALQFYCDGVLRLKKRRDIMSNGDAEGSLPIGVLIHMENTKLKAERPFRECFVTFMFGYGIDNISTNIDFLFDLRTKGTGDIAKKLEKGIVWNEGDEPVTKQKLIAFIEENNLEEELNNRVRAKWEAIEDKASEQVKVRKSRF